MSNISHIENELWKSADSLRAMSNLGLQQFAEPVLGVIFLKFADMRFQEVDKELKAEQAKSAGPRGPRPLSKADYLAKGVVYLVEEAQYKYLLNLPESVNLGEALNDAMKLIEEHNPSLSGILSKTFHKLSKNIEDNNQIIQGLLKTFNSKKMNSLEGDVFGNIYEYFLGKFALADGGSNGEFFTPRSIVKLIINIIEPFHGTIYDPACGSGGMFVQSLEYIKNQQHKTLTEATKDIAVYGQEKNETTVKIAKLSLAINGLDSSHIKEGNSFTADHHQALGKFDYVMANPPFNVKGVNKEAVQGNSLYTYGMPSVDNANYLWIQMFWTALSDKGRAGFVMANSAFEARNSEAKIREEIIRERAVDVIISVGPNMFYNVPLPCDLCFFDKNKINTDRKDTVLFINAKKIFRQVDRTHREFTDEQLEYITRIAQLYRGEKVDAFDAYIAMQKEIIQKEMVESQALLDESKDKDERKFLQTEIATLEERLTIADNLLELYNTQFSEGYDDVAGLCKVATLQEIEDYSRSLNPGRYAGVASINDDDFDFEATMTKLHNEFQELTNEAHKIEKVIVANMDEILSS